MNEGAPGFPFEPNAGGVWPMAEDDELVGQEIEQAVMTARMELPIEKGEGSQFARILFSLDAEMQSPVAKKYATDAIQRLVGQVVVTDATVVSDGAGAATVTVSYQRVRNDTPRTVSFDVGVTT